MSGKISNKDAQDLYVHLQLKEAMKGTQSSLAKLYGCSTSIKEIIEHHIEDIRWSWELMADEVY